MSKEWKYGIGGLIIGVLLGVLVARSAVNTNQVGMMQMMGMRSSANSGTIDAHFIEQMIPHHEDAITMAKLALQKAKKQEIKTLAQNIISAQESEITKMKGWYKDWYGREVSSGNQIMNQHGMMMGGSSMHMGMMGNNTDSQRLENASDFDRAFIEEMIPHHQMAVMMASMLKNGTTRPEMRTLADDIITAQTKEIDQMREWYQIWYQ